MLQFLYRKFRATRMTHFVFFLYGHVWSQFTYVPYEHIISLVHIYLELRISRDTLPVTGTSLD